MTPASSNAFDARPLVDGLLARAVDARASDIHIEPLGDTAEVRLRIDGLLQTIDRIPAETGRGIVLRLMVMAQLLTYKLEMPQEGRVRVALAGTAGGAPREVDARLAVMPTARGLRAVLRLPADLVQPRSLPELGLPAPIMAALQHFAEADAGMLLVTGPAGSGKTTTIYALLEHIAHVHPGISIVSVEDPVERVLQGVTQIEVSDTGIGGRMGYEEALRSILRQDPQVLMLGEIRDADTAGIAVQAALTGHRLICTLHAGHPGQAVARLIEMGIEPYQITGTLWGILTQRLVRRRAGTGGTTPSGTADVGAYRGRVPVAELGLVDEAVRAAILRRADAGELRSQMERQSSYVGMMAAAQQLVAAGTTDMAEIRRVLGDGPVSG